MSGSPVRAPDARASAEVELVIGRVLLSGAMAGIALVVVGVALMAINGIDPMSATFPRFDLSRVLPDIIALRAEGYLWAGILVLIATPIARVVGEFVTFAVRRDRIMMGVAAAVLAVVALSVMSALVLEG